MITRVEIEHIGQDIDVEALARVPAHAARAAGTEAALKGLGWL
ncbi:hypothetical protein [Actinomadura sp. CNU-125]|nr:hypothetical protein [Actinomadura sp. CNU-125]